MTTVDRVAAALKAARKGTQMSQVELADHLGLSGPMVSRIESGDRPLKTHLALRWLRLCGREVRVVPAGSDDLPVDLLSADDIRRFANLMRAWPTLHPDIQHNLRLQMEAWGLPEEGVARRTSKGRT
jgi:transcriptional regulator with XRE-family HTH domain